MRKLIKFLLTRNWVASYVREILTYPLLLKVDPNQRYLLVFPVELTNTEQDELSNILPDNVTMLAGSDVVVLTVVERSTKTKRNWSTI